MHHLGLIKRYVGMRTLKTGIAVVITLYLGQTFLVSNAFYAVIGTIFALQNTVKNSLVAGKNRLLGTVIGAIIGYFFALTTIDNPIFIGLAVIVTIICCNSLKISSSIIIAATVCVSILIGIKGQDPLVYSILRTTDTSIGIIVGIIVNYFIAQPNYLGRLTEEIETIEQITKNLVKDILIHQDLDVSRLKGELNRLNSIYQNYCADTQFDKNPVSLNQLKITIEACHDIYFHAKCIACLSVEETELTVSNRMQIITFFNEGCQGNVQLEDPIDSIFNYHIHKILDELRVLTVTVDALTDHLNK